MGSLKSPCTTSYRLLIKTIALNCYFLRKSHFCIMAYKIQDGGSPPPWILGSRDGFLEKPMCDHYRSSIDTIALNCLIFEKITFFGILATDRRTNGQTDGHDRCVKPQSRYRELRLNNQQQHSAFNEHLSFLQPNEGYDLWLWKTQLSLQ